MIRLETLALTSKDLARSRAFYAGKLGFKVLEDMANRAFIVDAGGIKLHVDVAGARSPLAQAEPRMVFHTSGLTQRCTALRGGAGCEFGGRKDVVLEGIPEATVALAAVEDDPILEFRFDTGRADPEEPAGKHIER